MLEHPKQMTRAAREDGFTLVEVLIGMVLTVIVFGATLTVLDAFSNQYGQAQKRLSAQDSARLGVDRIVRQLRNIASPVTTPKLLERATPNDIVFQTVGTPSGGSSGNTTGTERVRYCLAPDTSPGSAGTKALYAETQQWSTSTPPASPWSSDPTAAIPCPDSPSGVTTTVAARALTNNSSPSQSVFCFNNTCGYPSDLSQVFTVQINLFVNPTPTFTKAEVQISSAAFLRNQPRPPVPTFSPTYTGKGGVLLNGGASYSPDGEDLSYSWACTASCSAAQAAGLSDADTGLVDWQPGAGTYTVTLTVTDQTGLSKTYTADVAPT